MAIFSFGRKSLISAALVASSISFTALADDFISIAKNGKVFDTPDATGYVTLNTGNKEVVLSPGMVFKVIEKSSGWNMIEYSPGLRGYVSDQIKAQKSVLPKPGVYQVKNKPVDKIEVGQAAQSWTAKSGTTSFKGKQFGNYVIFFDAAGNPKYSLVDLGEGPVVMVYDNSVTHFF